MGVSAIGVSGNGRQWVSELKKIFDDAGLTFIDASNGEVGQSANFIDPDEIPKTMRS
jgi:hypothetical protein